VVPPGTVRARACDDGSVIRPSGAELLRAVGLLVDGPVRWGQPVQGRGPGIYIVELSEPRPAAPIDLAKVGKWLERVPTLRLDGERPSSRALAARLASLWLADATVVYVGASAASIGGRVAALNHHVLGDPRPHADGQWLHALRELDGARVWWATTDAPEEYLDAVLEAFAAAGPAAPSLPGGADRPTGALVLPWATTRRPTGERQAHGISGAVLPAPVAAPAPPTRIIDVPAGDADGAVTEVKGTGTVRRAPATRGPARATPTRAVPKAHRGPAPAAPVELSADAHARMVGELDQLVRGRRPEVVARIKAARELGDLRENAEYHAAREEQSFLEGRIRQLEDRLRRAVVIEAGADGAVTMGSTVTVESGGERSVFAIVGTAESDPAKGRLSAASPVGKALIGKRVGDEVVVRTPRGDVRYRVVGIE
jgi:transcription elongation factor GreA